MIYSSCGDICREEKSIRFVSKTFILPLLNTSENSLLMCRGEVKGWKGISVRVCVNFDEVLAKDGEGGGDEIVRVGMFRKFLYRKIYSWRQTKALTALSSENIYTRCLHKWVNKSQAIFNWQDKHVFPWSDGDAFRWMIEFIISAVKRGSSRKFSRVTKMKNVESF